MTKIFLAICLVIALTDAAPVKGPEKILLTEKQLDDLLWSMEAISLIGQAYMEEFGKPKSRPKMMNKIQGTHLPRPSVAFHPFRIAKGSKELKKQWNGFEFKGFGPVTMRPFTYLDLRIIG